MKNFLKNFLFFILNYGQSKNKASILMYHSIGENKAFFTVKENTFYKQLEYLKQKKIKVVKLSILIEMLKNKDDISRCVCLTFDDAYKDNLTVALPILKKFDYPATIFVATNLLGKKFLTSDEVELEIISDEDLRCFTKEPLLEFMPHSSNHVELDKISPLDYDREIEKSRVFLMAVNNKKSDILAYPKGKYSNEVVKYLENNTWSGAVTVNEGLVDLADNLFSLKRNSIDSSTSFIQFRGKIGLAVDRYAKLKKYI